MSAFGSTLNFGVKIGVQDDSRRGTASFLSNLQSAARLAAKPITIPVRIAQGSLGLLRDINLGLAPVVRAMDAAIERGGALEVQQKAFTSLTGRSGRQAEYLARRLQDASSGTLRLGEAMALANRALSSGMGLDELGVAIEFIGKKAVATGKDARQAMDTVITGLIRGSTLFLDDFGILVDGLEGVKRTYDSIRGHGAFETLRPAAQKAETVRQAIEEMRVQMGRINVSGRETVFLYTGIKTQIGDAVDRLVLAAAKSVAMKDALAGIRNALAGITQHFSDGGTFGELLFGKSIIDKAGREIKSGGVFGLIKAGLMDAGEALGRGMVGGALKATAEILRFLTPKDHASQQIMSGVEQDKGLDRGPIFTNWLGGKFEVMRRMAAQPIQGSHPVRYDGKAPWTIAVGSSAVGQGPLEPYSLNPNAGMQTGQGMWRRAWNWFSPNYYHAVRGMPMLAGESYSNIWGGVKRNIVQPGAGLFKTIDDAMDDFSRRTLQPLFDWFSNWFRNRPLKHGLIARGFPMNPLLGAATAMGSGAIGAGDGLMSLFNGSSSLADTLDAAGSHILSGGVFAGGSRWKNELDAFSAVFGGKATEDLYSDESLQERLAAIRGELRLSARGRAMRTAQRNLAERELRRTGAQSYRAARRLASQEAQRLRKAGYVVTRDKEEELRFQFQDRTFNELGGHVAIARRNQAANDLDKDSRISKVLSEAATRSKGGEESKTANAIESSAQAIISAAKSMDASSRRSEAAVNRLVAAFAGADSEIAAVAER